MIAVPCSFLPPPDHGAEVGDIAFVTNSVVLLPFLNLVHLYEPYFTVFLDYLDPKKSIPVEMGHNISVSWMMLMISSVPFCHCLHCYYYCYCCYYSVGIAMKKKKHSSS